MDEQAALVGIKGWRVWAYDQVCRLLDDKRDIAAAYFPLTTSGARHLPYRPAQTARDLGPMSPAEDLAEQVSGYQSSGDTVTLRYIRGNVIAVSGVTPQGVIYYQRDVVYPTVVYSLVWGYPAADKARYESLVDHTAGSFSPGPGRPA